MRHRIYTKVIEVLADEVTKTCAESGTLLKRVWSEYYAMVRERLDKASSFVRARDLQVNQIASSILSKYEVKVKENDYKFQHMQEQIRDTEQLLDDTKKRLFLSRAESESLRNKQLVLEDENARLQNENTELKAINRALRACFVTQKHGISPCNPLCLEETNEEIEHRIRDEIFRIKLKSKKAIKEQKEAVARRQEEEMEKRPEPPPAQTQRLTKRGTLVQNAAEIAALGKRVTLRDAEDFPAFAPGFSGVQETHNELSESDEKEKE